MKKAGWKKILGRVGLGALALGVVFLRSCAIQGWVTSGSNYGVPRIYGHSFLYVASDSMEGEEPDSIPKGTAVIVEEAKPAELHIGEIVCFYDRHIMAPNTHRLIEEPEFDQGEYRFHTRGDNASSFLFAYEGEEFGEEELIGRVVGHNDVIAFLLRVFSPSAAGSASADGFPYYLLFPIIVAVLTLSAAAVVIVTTVKKIKRLEAES